MYDDEGFDEQQHEQEHGQGINRPKESWPHLWNVLPDQLGSIIRLAKRDTDALGFLPLPSLTCYAQRLEIFATGPREEPHGFVVFTRSQMSHPRHAHIYQLCVAKSHRRSRIGTRLIHALMREVKLCGAHAVTCWVASDLDANSFWLALGFVKDGQRPGGSRRNRHHNHYFFDLREQPCQPREFSTELPESPPSCETAVAAFADEQETWREDVLL